MTSTGEFNHYIEGNETSPPMYKAKKLAIGKFHHDIDPNDLILVGDAVIEKKGLISQHIESANKFYSIGIPQIIQGFKIKRTITNRRSDTPEDREIERIECEVITKDTKLRKPTTLEYSTGKEETLYPNEALVEEKYYSGGLSFSCDIIAKAYKSNGTFVERKATVKDFKVSDVPVVKKSIMCNLYGLSEQAQMELGEDPKDPGGNFVLRGEWAVDCTENITFNQPKIYINEGYGKSRVRCEFISKPGDAYQNSDMITIILYNDNTLNIEIVRDKLSKTPIPFFLLFRAIGWSNDKDIMDWIIYDYEREFNKELTNTLIKCMNAKYGKTDFSQIYEQNEALRTIVDLTPDDAFKYYDLKDKPENYHAAMKEVLRIFDMHCLPHIGMTSDSRYEKLKYLALLVRKTLLVWLDYIPQTDRDSYRNKRMHAVGENYAKTFKTFFNQTVVLPIKRQMLKDFNNTPFVQVNLVNLVKGPIFADDFERLIVQTIISGNKSSLKMKRKSIVNRLASQLLHRKNQLNVYATMRQMASASADNAKQSERASKMRRVHMSQIGHACVTHSPPEGEKVGINKQMCIFAFIAPSSSSEVLKKLLSDDKDIVNNTAKISPTFISKNSLARVFVNGHIIGYTKSAPDLVVKYRKMRRSLKINPHATVYWDNVQNEVHLLVDIGRSCRALMIVYNNKRDNDVCNIKGKFQQGLAITSNDINEMYQGKKSLDDLLIEGKIEYITAEEQENYYICPNFEQLNKDRHDELNEYTHCDLPQALLGITALTAPFGNHNQPGRVTYQTTQGKQTCGYYALNWPFRMDKELFLQYTNEHPLVRTLTNKYLHPNGCNTMVAVMCYSGFNQEDSLIVNQAASDRGLFDGCKMTYKKTEVEQKEEICNPDASKTDGLKSANYGKLVKGIVTEGTVIEEGDVLIGKCMPLPKGKSDKYKYLDRSIVYKSKEKAIVQKVVDGRNEEGVRFVKVGLRKPRPTAVGDKFSSRSGQKGIGSLLMREADMPSTVNGIRPMFIFNPHGFPSRMTCAQLIECLLGKVCALKGGTFDGTMFKKVDIESIAAELEQYGYNRYGYERMISGITGEFIDGLVFFGPTFYQRLQKFVADAEYSVRHALTDALTMQPLDGQGSGGGLRIGGMEGWVLMSHGASGAFSEKMRNHSDGYTEYICRCGKTAIVNHKRNIYKCKHCGDDADITAVPSTWTSKTFIQEMESINVGIRRRPRPYTYHVTEEEKEE